MYYCPFIVISKFFFRPQEPISNPWEAILPVLRRHACPIRKQMKAGKEKAVS